MSDFSYIDDSLGPAPIQTPDIGNRDSIPIVTTTLGGGFSNDPSQGFRTPGMADSTPIDAEDLLTIGTNLEAQRIASGATIEEFYGSSGIPDYFINAGIPVGGLEEEEVNLDQTGLEPEVPLIDNQTREQVDSALQAFENALKTQLELAGVDASSSEEILNALAAAKQKGLIDLLPDPDEMQKELESQALAGGGIGVKIRGDGSDVSILLGVPLIGGTDPLEIKLKENGKLVNIITSVRDTAKKVFENITAVPLDILDELGKLVEDPLSIFEIGKDKDQNPIITLGGLILESDRIKNLLAKRHPWIQNEILTTIVEEANKFTGTGFVDPNDGNDDDDGGADDDDGNPVVVVEPPKPPEGGGKVVDPPPVTSCPSPETLINLTDGNTKQAGDLTAGDVVYTQHEDTLAWGEHPVTYVEIVPDQKRLKLTFDHTTFTCSYSHKFYVEGSGWTEVKNISIGDFVSGHELLKIEETESGDVVKIQVKDAHTYISEEMLSHNKSPVRPPEVEPPVKPPGVVPPPPPPPPPPPTTSSGGGMLSGNRKFSPITGGIGYDLPNFVGVQYQPKDYNIELNRLINDSLFKGMV